MPSLTAPRSSTAPRPEPGAVLLESIQQRDAVRSLRLVQQWVHRRGLASLQDFQSTTLASVAGSEACQWLQALLESPADASAIPPAPAAPIRVHDLIDPDGVIAAEPEPPAMESLLEVEAAFAALAAEFAASAPTPAAPEPAPLEAEKPPLIDEAPPPVAAALPLSFSIAAATDQAAANAARSALAGVPAAETSATEPEAERADAALPVDGTREAEQGPQRPTLLPGRLPRLGRLKRLMRGCYQGAIGSLQAARAMQEQPEFLVESDSEGFGAESGADMEVTGADSADSGADIGAASETAAAFPAALDAPTLADAPVTIAEVALVEPVAPLPAFHAPAIAGLEDGAASKDPAAAAVGLSAVGKSAAELKRVSASLAFRLPRLGAAAVSQGPAPAPAVLADLRAWLPDDAEDLPRAC
ncbi:MAG: hypothetical protein ACKO25_07555 [Cyanobium sp.]